MMLWKNRDKRVSVCLTVVTSCLVLAAVWAILATPKTALAKRPGDEATRYDVTMTGDLTLLGAFNQDPPPGWGRSFETGIRVSQPRVKICVATAFLATRGVTLDGEPCGDGVIPDGNGHPNWGTLTVEGDATGVIVTWHIGETDAITGKTRLYTLRTIDPVSPVKAQGSGTWPKGDGDDTTVYTVTVSSGAHWSLVQAKPGNLDTTLTSTQDTTIAFTEYMGS